MKNFEFRNPTKLIFGKGTIASLTKELPQGRKIMITFGGGSVKNNGVYSQVITALKGFDYIEFWGIEPNPLVETVRKAVEIAKKENVDFILSVGGGSTLDATKVIAAAACSELDAWDIVLKGVYKGEALPVAAVMTLPATCSEMNNVSVISNDATKEKYAVNTYYPKFSILAPETTYSLPIHQLRCGLADTYIHVMEQYLTETNISPLMDRWAEGILLTLKEVAPKVINDSKNYENMSNFMLCASMALNGMIAMGVSQDWATHMIGHELTALTGLTHGHTLTIILPALMRIMCEQKKGKILQYGERVLGISEGSEQERIDATIVATEDFFRSLGLKTRLSENGINEDVSTEIVKRVKERGEKFGEKETVTYVEVEKILSLCK